MSLWQNPEFRAWYGMKYRCSNPMSYSWHNYGGRGITVCRRWAESFDIFLNDMGPKPSPKHSLDRYPDNNGNYEPDNCRWATPKQQRENRRPAHELPPPRQRIKPRFKHQDVVHAIKAARAAGVNVRAVSVDCTGAITVSP